MLYRFDHSVTVIFKIPVVWTLNTANCPNELVSPQDLLGALRGPNSHSPEHRGC